MAKLIQCKACGKEISKNAKICPNCGEPVKKLSWWKKIIGFFVIILIIISVFLLTNPKVVECSESLYSAKKVEDNTNIVLQDNDYVLAYSYMGTAVSRYEKAKELCQGTFLEEEASKRFDAVHTLYESPDFLKKVDAQIDFEDTKKN